MKVRARLENTSVRNVVERFIGHETTTFLLDNSSLSDFLVDPELVAEVARSPDEFRLFLSFDTYSELVKGDVTRVIKRIRALRPLLSLNFPKVFISAGLLALMAKERKNAGNLKNIPLLINSPKWPALLSAFNAPSDDLEISISKHKDRMLEKRDVTKNLQEIDNFIRKSSGIEYQTAIRTRLMNFDPQDEIKNLLFDHRSVGFSRSAFKKVLRFKDAGKFPTTRLYFYLIQMRLLGNHLKSYHPNDELKFMHRIVAGNWYDLAIVAQSYSYTYFVTEDRDQRGFCNHLNTLGLSKCKANSLHELRKIISAKSASKH